MRDRPIPPHVLEIPAAVPVAAPLPSAPNGHHGHPVLWFFRFLRRHPVVALLFLSPGIPEYLSSSSPFSALAANPAGFFFQLLLNLGLYGPGVLLIREAMVRWKSGWVSILLLGAAYGIAEEGIALSTLFNPAAGPVGSLGSYGHWVGVNWVWLPGVLLVHMVFSISVPILLLGLALPETRGQSLLTARGITLAFAIFLSDVTLLMVAIVRGAGYWMGWPALLASVAAIAALVGAAYYAPPRWIRARRSVSASRPVTAAILGGLFFPLGILVPGFSQAAGLAPWIAIGALVAAELLLLGGVLGVVGARSNESQLVGLALGILVPVAIFGLIAKISIPVVLLADLAMLLFFRKLWQKYRAGGSPGRAAQSVSAS